MGPGQPSERAAAEWLPRLTAPPGGRRVIDVAQGSGAVGIAGAKAVRQVRIVARDVSARALRMATANIARHRLRRRIVTVKADLLRGARPADLILANLPYISGKQRRGRPKEPKIAPPLPPRGRGGGVDPTRANPPPPPAAGPPGGGRAPHRRPAPTRRA